MGTINLELARNAGLDAERLQMHANRINDALSGFVDTFIPVADACTVDNGIIAWENLENWLCEASEHNNEFFFAAAHRHWQKKHLVAMIPAAGAASRFLAEMQKFINDTEANTAKLQHLSNEYFSAQTVTSLNAGECKKIALDLNKKELAPKFVELPNTILMQEFDDIKKAWIHFGNSLQMALDTQKFLPQANCACNKEAKKADGKNNVYLHWGEVGSNLSESSCGGGGCGSACASCTCSDEELNSKIIALQAYAACKIIISLYGGVAKALVPTTLQGDSFLRLKMCEQISLMPTSGTVLVVPAGQVDYLTKVINIEGEALSAIYGNPFELSDTPFAPKWLYNPANITGKWLVLEQGSNLSTIRFDANGEALVENNKYSPVAAGHGELIHLFDRIARSFSDADCVHIRNIDNVIGANGERVAELAGLTDAFKLLRDGLEYIRFAVNNHVAMYSQHKQNNITNMNVFYALDFVLSLGFESVQTKLYQACFNSQDAFTGLSCENIYSSLAAVFYWPSLNMANNALENWQSLQQNLQRPLSVLGVVKKESGDVGGGPVFVKMANGSTAKLCMEMPHAAPADATKYFAANGKCTHFNPVLAYFELKTNTYRFQEVSSPGNTVDFSKLFDDRFWLLSKKDYMGKSVCYHETVLYELIGNSMTTNLVFIEVPRSLFNPHKTIFDSLGSSRETYGFEGTLI